MQPPICRKTRFLAQVDRFDQSAYSTTSCGTFPATGVRGAAGVPRSGREGAGAPEHIHLARARGPACQPEPGEDVDDDVAPRSGGRGRPCSAMTTSSTTRRNDDFASIARRPARYCGWRVQNTPLKPEADVGSFSRSVVVSPMAPTSNCSSDVHALVDLCSHMGANPAALWNARPSAGRFHRRALHPGWAGVGSSPSVNPRRSRQCVFDLVEPDRVGGGGGPGQAKRNEPAAVALETIGAKS